MFSKRSMRISPDTLDEGPCHPNKVSFSTDRVSGRNSPDAECDITENETFSLSRDTGSARTRECSVDIRRRQRLLSTAKRIHDLDHLDQQPSGLPEHQQRHSKLFAKTLARLRKRELLPSYERIYNDYNSSRRQSRHEEWVRRQTECFSRWKLRYKSSRLELWQESIKSIEGTFGSGVLAYFLFLRRLLVLNLVAGILLAVFVITPQLAFPLSADANSTTDGDTGILLNQSAYCSQLYVVNWTSDDIPMLLLEFLQGTGWMEKTLLFYGYYSNVDLYIGSWDGIVYVYDLPLAYLLVTSLVFGLSLVLMAKHTATGFRNRILEADHRSNKYSSLVLGGWDYTLNNEKVMKRKHSSLYQEIMVVLLEDEELKRRMNRTGREQCMLLSARLFINIFVLATLAVSGYSIYQATQQSLLFRERYDYEDINRFVQLLMEYLPSLSVTILNAIIPPLFNQLVKGEDFSPEVEIQVTLARTVFLRLASVAVLLGTLYLQVMCPVKESECNVGISPDCPQFRCWETYVGQQIYKLVILDLFVVFAKVFLVDFPRRFVVTKYNCRLTRMIGKAEFMIPKEVLDLVYSQILCWLGLFFSPLTPAICAVKSVIVFYLKKLTCLYNHVPPSRPYKASRSQLFFMTVLLTSFVLCCIPVGYIVFRIPPSRGCGPFRIYDVIFDVIITNITHWPIVLGQICSFITSAVFIVPLCVLLVLLVYYYSAVANARKQMLDLMAEQLLMEGQDKKYLLIRLNELTGP